MVTLRNVLFKLDKCLHSIVRDSVGRLAFGERESHQKVGESATGRDEQLAKLSLFLDVLLLAISNLLSLELKLNYG